VWLHDTTDIAENRNGLKLAYRTNERTNKQTNEHGIETTIVGLGYDEAWGRRRTIWGSEGVGMDVPLPRLLDYHFWNLSIGYYYDYQLHLDRCS
jgi:hypothetical protein